MSLQLFVLSALILLDVVLIAVLRLRPGIRAAAGGKALAFVALFVLPGLSFWDGTAHHLERATSTEFCLSCHVMESYGRSLAIDSPAYLPAAHTQNHRLPAGRECYSCHTSYTMFGDFEAKLRGIQHVVVNYTGRTPDRLQLYEPYSNRECLGCHAGARSFEEGMFHAAIRPQLDEGEPSCLQCHDSVHAVDQLDDLPMWELPASAESN